MEKAMAPHSSTLAWKIPWTEEPGKLQSMGSLGVGHNWATSLSLFTLMHWRKKWQPTPVFLPGEAQGRGSLVGCRLWGRTESDTTEVTQQQQQWLLQLVLIEVLTSLMAQQQRILSTRERWVRSLSWEDPEEKEMAIHSSILAWKNLMDRGAWRLHSLGLQRVGHDSVTEHTSWLCSYCVYIFLDFYKKEKWMIC